MSLADRKSPESRAFHGIIKTAPKSACNTRRGLTRTSGTSREGLPDMVPKICSIEACDRQVLCKGLCNPHYIQQRTGKPITPPVLRGAGAEARFWQKVEGRESGKCWPWVGAKTSGYGHFHGEGTLRRAHCFSFELHVGPIPAGMVIDHMCHNRACVNPEHLQLATPKQNSENVIGARADSSSGLRGVIFHKQSGKWRACVKHEGKAHYAGLHATREAAAVAATELRLRLFTNNLEDLGLIA